MTDGSTLKHAHACQALEHYRSAAKEQREHEQRRHEQQVAQLQAELRQLQQAAITKLEELTRLNQQGAQLTADLTQTRHALYDEQARARLLEKQVLEYQELKVGSADLRRQLLERQAEVAATQEKLAQAGQQSEMQGNRLRELELSLAQAEARARTLEQITAGLQAFMAQQNEHVDSAATAEKASERSSG